MRRSKKKMLSFYDDLLHLTNGPYTYSMSDDRVCAQCESKIERNGFAGNFLSVDHFEYSAKSAFPLISGLHCG